MIVQNGLFAVLAFVLIAAGVTDAKKPRKVVGGTAAYPGELPYQVSLRYRGQHHCGGAIISNRHILTAATCIKQVPDFNNGVVVTGSIRVNEGQTHRIKGAYYHSSWNQYTAGNPNDIAIIVLAAPMVFTSYQNLIRLPVAPAPNRSVAVVSGWGKSVYPYTYSLYLNKAAVYTLSADECQTVLRSTTTIWTHQLCTYSSAGVGICLGDGGGPLVYNNQLIGVVSWGFLCGNGYPDVYSSVYHYLEWINYQLSTT